MVLLDGYIVICNVDRRLIFYRTRQAATLAIQLSINKQGVQLVN